MASCERLGDVVGRAPPPVMHVLAVVEVPYGSGFEGRAVILTAVPTGDFFFFAMTGRLWYGGIAHFGLRVEAHHLKVPANAWLPDMEGFQ